MLPNRIKTMPLYDHTPDTATSHDYTDHLKLLRQLELTIGIAIWAMEQMPIIQSETEHWKKKYDDLLMSSIKAGEQQVASTLSLLMHPPQVPK